MNEIELQAKLQTLEKQVQAQERLWLAIALALSPDDRKRFDKLLKLVAAMTAFEEGIDVARAISLVRDKFIALTDPDLSATPAEVALALQGYALLLAQTEPAQRDALQSWLSVATGEEIADDVLSALRALLRPPAATEAPKRPKGGS